MASILSHDHVVPLNGLTYPETNFPMTSEETAPPATNDEDAEDEEDEAPPVDNKPTDLMIACQRQDIDQIRKILADKKTAVASSSDRDNVGKTALHYCVENATSDSIKLLLSVNKSLIDVQDDNGHSALHLAAVAGNLQSAKCLLEYGAAVNIRDKEEHCVVHWATACGHADIIDLVCSQGADIELADVHGAAPLHYAAQLTSPTALTSRPNSEDDIAKGQEVLNKLLSIQVNVDCRDGDQRTPLLWAASAGSSFACEKLLEKKADIEAADKDGLTALHCAASKGHVDCVTSLLTHGANVDCIDDNGCTPLFYAVTLGRLETASHVLENNANVNHIDLRGRSPVHCAATSGQIDCLKLLHKHEANLWKPSKRGELPLHEAALQQRIEVVKYLLEEAESPTDESSTGDPVNFSNREGRTCLHIAALKDNLPLAEYLVEQHHADKSVIWRHKGREVTPYDVAVALKHQECALYLKPPDKEDSGTNEAAADEDEQSSANNEVDSTFRDDDDEQSAAAANEDETTADDDNTASKSDEMNGVDTAVDDEYTAPRSDENNAVGAADDDENIAPRSDNDDGVDPAVYDDETVHKLKSDENGEEKNDSKDAAENDELQDDQNGVTEEKVNSKMSPRMTRAVTFDEQGLKSAAAASRRLRPKTSGMVSNGGDRASRQSDRSPQRDKRVKIVYQSVLSDANQLSLARNQPQHSALSANRKQQNYTTEEELEKKRDMYKRYGLGRDDNSDDNNNDSAGASSTKSRSADSANPSTSQSRSKSDSKDATKGVRHREVSPERRQQPVGTEDKQVRQTSRSRSTTGQRPINNFSNLIQEQVRIFEIRRLAALELEKAKRCRLRVASATTGHRVIRSVNVEKYHARRLATDFNTMAQFHQEHKIDGVTKIDDLENELRGQLSQLVVDEARLKRLEKVASLYSSRSDSATSRMSLPPVHSVHSAVHQRK